MASKAILAIQIVSDASKAAKEIDTISAKTSKMGKVSSAAGKLFAVGLAGVAVAAVKFANAAAEDEAAASKLAQSLKKATDATDADVAKTEEWIEAKGRALGIADDQLRPAIAKLAIATGDLGKAQKLASLAMDISAGSGKSLESVTQALAKAQTGSVAGLSKLGITTKDTVADTAALKSAQIAVTTAYRAQTKAVEEHGASSAEARLASQKYALAQDKLKAAQDKTKSSTISAKEAAKRLADVYEGAAAKAAETTAGKQAKLKVQMDELKESIGARLLPVLAALVTAGLAVVAWVDENQRLALILVGVIGALVGIIAAVNFAMKVWTALTKVWTAVTKAAAIAQKIFNAAMRANPIGLIITAVLILIGLIVLLYKKNQKFRDLVKAVGKIAATAFGWIVDRVKDVAKWIGEHVPKAVEKMRNIIVPIIKVITAPWRFLFNLIKDIVKWVAEKIPGGIETLKRAIGPAMDVVLAPFRILKDLIDKILGLIGKIKIPSVGDALDAINPFGRAVSGAGVSTAGSAVEVHVHMDRSFVGSASQLARELAPAISTELGRIQVRTRT